MVENDWISLGFEAGRVFSPAAPINEQALFAGRLPQLRKVIDAISQRGQHAIIYGERGVGKTSLANVISSFVNTENMIPLRVNCESVDTYQSVWKKIFSLIKLNKKDSSIGFFPQPKGEYIDYAATLPNTKPDTVREALGIVSRTHLPIIIIDEFDRIKSDKEKTMFADTVKTLSDQSISATVLFVGVADSVTQLIKEHTSIERALVQIQMPRMSQKELGEIVSKGLDRLKMTIVEDAKKRIIRLSQGLPHYTHMLSLHAARAAIDSKQKHITLGHVDNAINKALEEAQQTIISAYHNATMSPRSENIFSRVLLACALAKTDDLGYFSPADVRDPLSTIMGRRYEIPSYSRHLHDFSGENRGPILNKIKIGQKNRYKFRFVNPLMQPYIIMQGYSKGILKDEQLN